VERLLELALAREGEFVPTRVGNGSGGVVNPSIRSSLLLRDFGELRAELEVRFTAVLDEAVRVLRLSPIRLHHLELELVAHNDGAFYDEHIDTFTTLPDSRSDRALTGVYYFHRQPKAFSGGDLRLKAIAPRADGERHVTDIPPGQDEFVLFPSWVPHEVRKVSCPSAAFADSRFAINCWYRSDRRA
jgi:Rps23 Pro-64 3,4-dihydroxylase Tpa1-like proline 4-hydroxylase